MSTTLNPPETYQPTQITQTPFLSNLNRWSQLGAPEGATDSSKNGGSLHPGALLSLVLVVCLSIFVVKCVISYRDVCYEGDSLILFHKDLPRWQSVPIWLGKTFYCCLEDFAVGVGFLLVGTLVLRLLFNPWLKKPAWLDVSLRGGFWSVAYTLAIVAVGFAIVNVFIYHNLEKYLNQRMVKMAGTSLEKSVQDEVTPQRIFLLVVSTLGVVSFQLLLLTSFPNLWRRLAYFVCRPLVLKVALGVMVLAVFLSRLGLGEASSHPFLRNPHLLMAMSFAPAAPDIPNDFVVPEDAEYLPGQPLHGDLKLEKRPTNLIVIVLESTGSHWMHNYGAQWETTPCLEKLGKQSIVFENFYANSDHTIASALPIFGSINNHDSDNCTVYDARDVVGPNKNFPVPAASTWMKKQGYYTYFMGAGGKAVWEGYKNLGPAFLPHGFDLAKDGYKFWSKRETDWPLPGDDHDDKSLFEDARRCLDDAKEQKKPFFLMLWNYDTHWRYTDGDGPDFDTKTFPKAVQEDDDRVAQMKRYFKSIWRVDRLIADLHADLEKRGIADDTLIVITADHGQSFGHHKVWTHGYKLYEEEIRVPCIMINKHIGHLGPKNKTMCSHVDMWPTITEILGLPCDSRWQGRSIFAKIPDENRRVYIWVGGLASLREGDYKYIWDWEDSEQYLFNITEDPEEKTNLIKNGKQKDRVKRMRERLKTWMAWQKQWNIKQLATGKREPD